MPSIQRYESLARVADEMADETSLRPPSSWKLRGALAPELEADSDDCDLEAEPPRGCLERTRMKVKAIFDSPRESFAGQIVQGAVISLILFSTCCVIAETVPELSDYSSEFGFVEEATTLLFTVELVARAVTADNAVAYMTTISSAIDVAAVLPWYIEKTLGIFFPHGGVDEDVADSFKTLRIVRLVQFIRLLRVLRLAKAAKHSDMIATVVESIRASLAGFGALMAFILMGSVFAATFAYFLESEEPGTAFTSIPAALWWAMPTITGVGYGDVVPETVAGKCLGAVTMVGGILITSLSVAIMTKSFVESYERTTQLKKVQATRRALHNGASAAGKRSGGLALRTHPNHSEEEESGTSSMPSQRLQPPVGRSTSDLVSHFVFAEDHPLVSLNKLEHALVVVLASLDLETTTKVQKCGGETDHESLLRSNWDFLKGQNKMWFKHVRRLAEQSDSVRSDRGPSSATLPGIGSSSALKNFRRKQPKFKPMEPLVSESWFKD